MNKVKKNNIELILDFSEFYDFELVTNYNQDENVLIDGILDLSEFYDFELTDEEINKNELIYLTPKCINCSDAILSLDSNYRFLLTDDYNFIEINGYGGLLMYH